MKRLTIFVVALALASVAAYAQDNPKHPKRNQNQTIPVTTQSTSQSTSNPQSDTSGERNLPDQVDIVGTPNVETSSDSARITWHTNNLAATDVWLQGGGIRGHRTEYQRGGRRDHSVTFSNLKPNTTYTYLIRSGQGEVRYQGSFTTR